MSKFTFFFGASNPRGYLSQWYPLSFRDDNGRKYNCTEQYMMAEKARLFGDEAMEKAIMKSSSPREQKRLGRRVSGFSKGKWNAACKQIVYRGNYFKFSQNPDFLALLLATTGELAEASPYDRVWGIGLAATHRDASNKARWRGKNWLGETLTQLRQDLSQ
tara:strand:+ start:2155 stop:2637 length:483 start_codon:yes stop_codon:yes gene_type:complete